MSWINDIGSVVVVLIIFWIIGLLLSMFVPVWLCKLVHIQTNFWHVGFVSGLVYAIGTWIWFTR